MRQGRCCGDRTRYKRGIDRVFPHGETRVNSSKMIPACQKWRETIFRAYGFILCGGDPHKRGYTTARAGIYLPLHEPFRRFLVPLARYAPFHTFDTFDTSLRLASIPHHTTGRKRFGKCFLLTHCLRRRNLTIRLTKQKRTTSNTRISHLPSDYQKLNAPKTRSLTQPIRPNNCFRLQLLLNCARIPSGKASPEGV